MCDYVCPVRMSAQYDQVYDGAYPYSPLLGSFSGSRLPPRVVSSGSDILIRFKTDLDIAGQGWEAEVSGEYM